MKHDFHVLCCRYSHNTQTYCILYTVRLLKTMYFYLEFPHFANRNRNSTQHIIHTLAKETAVPNPIHIFCCQKNAETQDFNQYSSHKYVLPAKYSVSVPARSVSSVLPWQHFLPWQHTSSLLSLPYTRDSCVKVVWVPSE